MLKLSDPLECTLSSKTLEEPILREPKEKREDFELEFKIIIKRKKNEKEENLFSIKSNFQFTTDGSDDLRKRAHGLYQQIDSNIQDLINHK